MRRVDEYTSTVAASMRGEYKNGMAKKLPPLAFRPDEDVRAALEGAAEADERSLSWLINSILRTHFKLEKPKTEPKADTKVKKAK